MHCEYQFKDSKRYRVAMLQGFSSKSLGRSSIDSYSSLLNTRYVRKRSCGDQVLCTGIASEGLGLHQRAANNLTLIEPYINRRLPATLYTPGGRVGGRTIELGGDSNVGDI